MHVQLPGDGIGAPSLDMVVAQDLRLELRGYRHGSRPLPRRKKSMRTNGEQGRPQQWQRHGGCSGAARRVCGLRVDAALALITSSGGGRGEP